METLDLNTIRLIEENAREIVGIRIDGDFYNVDFVSTDDCGELETIYAYQLDGNNLYYSFEFTLDDLKGKTIQVYKLQLIKGE